VFGDVSTYQKILAATDPATAKRLGRRVTPFDDRRWDAVVLDVAQSVVYSKFTGDDKCRRKLLSTGDKLICESTRSDRNWGTGLTIGEVGYNQPWRWRGTNILGWALLEVRARLRNEAGVGGGGEAAEVAGAAVDGAVLQAQADAPYRERGSPKRQSSKKRRRAVNAHLK